MTGALRDLWAAAKYDEDASCSYNEPLALFFRGQDFDIDAMGRALRTVVRRHDALRTVFRRDGSGLEILHDPPVALPITDLSEVPSAEREARFNAWLKEQASTAFDLATGPLYRFAVARLAEDRHVLGLTIHHLVTDGWSNGVLLRDLAMLYDAGGRAEGVDLTPAESFVAALDQQRLMEEQARQDSSHLLATYGLGRSTINSPRSGSYT